ncbi:MAG TPA: ribulose-phosphate 3-epimerase [Alloacidobacterium sp.]|nr:ribulose-phosphate 3-epimerase [Alloacidobacterium sp.]
MGRVNIEASLACADFRNLSADISQLVEAGIDYLHIDIMDGNFVPNFALNFDIMLLARALCAIPMDCHLMVADPERYVERAISSGAEFVSIHFEATHHAQRILQLIRDAGGRPGIALNPSTPLTVLEYILDDVDLITVMTVNPGFAGQKLVPAMLRKIANVRDLLRSKGRTDIEIQVDGNVSFQHIPAMLSAGATMLVCGTSSIFDKRYDIRRATEAVRELVQGKESRI